MGRNRRSDKHLPQRVYRRYGAYYWFPPKKDAQRLGKTAIRLGKTLSEAMLRWTELAEGSTTHYSMSDLMDRYMLKVAPKKAEKTYKDNLSQVQPLRAFFGGMRPEDVTPVHVYQYLEERGEKAPIAANRERALLSHIFTYAIRWGVVTANPCRGVKRNPEPRRNRYVTDEEYQAVWATGSSLVRGMMDLSYLTGLRKGDLLRLRLQDLRDEGILVEIGKSRRQDRPGKQMLFEWSPELRQVTDRARADSRESSP